VLRPFHSRTRKPCPCHHFHSLRCHGQPEVVRALPTHGQGKLVRATIFIHLGATDNWRLSVLRPFHSRTRKPCPCHHFHSLRCHGQLEVVRALPTHGQGKLVRATTGTRPFPLLGSIHKSPLDRVLMDVFYLFQELIVILDISIITGTTLPESKDLSVPFPHSEPFKPLTVIQFQKLLRFFCNRLLNCLQDSSDIIVLLSRQNQKMGMFRHDDVGENSKIMFFA
jgi:hypothetical protein